jgi:UDP-GlcNAc:undecaprenyl-phosphate/decaprenyl-phosphate GlcNAc-1-phosphate transferase
VTAELFVFAIALATSFVLTMPIRRLAVEIGMVDRPNARKLHQNPMPLLGGVAIYCGAVFPILFWLGGQQHWGQIAGLLAGATLLLLTGVLDDRGLLHHQVKLFLAMPVAAITVISMGVRFHVIGQFMPGALGNVCDTVLTFFWIVGITAAFSILDHMDGLVSGVAAIAAFFFTLLATLDGQHYVAPLAAAVCGASLGFLRWNFKPAKIFMGDGGAMFLGFMVAALGVKLRPSQAPQTVAWIIPLLVLAVPIFDTTLVTISRSRRGLLPFASPGKDHTAHRLANLSLGQRGAVLLMYGVGVFFGLLAVAVNRVALTQYWGLAIVVLLAGLAGVTVFEKLPYERQSKTVVKTTTAAELAGMSVHP